MRRFLKRVGVLIVAALTLILMGCGLEDYAYLYPPSAWGEGDVFYFTNDTRNDPSIFMGYKILYRFYKSTESITSDMTKIENLYDSYPTSIDTKMEGLGYKELKISDNLNTSLAIASADRNTSFTIRMNFTNAGHAAPGDVVIDFFSGSVTTTPPIASGTTKVYRSVASSSSFVGFSSDYLTEDKYSDLESGTNYDSSTGKTYLMLYVIAYGYDSSMKEIFGEPQYFSASQPYVDDLTVN